MARPSTVGQPTVPFPYRLVLNQWLLGLFGVTGFEQLAEPLRDQRLEGLDANRAHHFYHVLAARFPERPELPSELLLAYDRNIVRHTRQLGERRGLAGEPVIWKHFQYLTLLFAEIYLDRYFRDPERLRADLNRQIAAYNQAKTAADQVEPLALAADARTQLNKLAIWCATGAGKTLMMHANILQYRHYLHRHGRRRELNRMLLLTPSEGLSHQHLAELRASGLPAEPFRKVGASLFPGETVEILDIHKLRDEMGEKTIAVEAFGDSNLVLIDEGHRGASGGEVGAWMRFRNSLCAQGFSFEYSATFGQAVKGSRPLQDLYSKAVLVDYSYRWFYGDGFGKDYRILNIDGEAESQLDLYLTACVLTFFQQLRYHAEQGRELQPFQLEKPLWVFVGGSVNAVQTRRGRQVSDVLDILLFLARFAGDRSGSIRRIQQVLSRGVVTAQGRNLFESQFPELMASGLKPERLYDEILERLFNHPSGGRLYVENLKGAAGEIALRLGGGEPFGVISVGDDRKLCRLCETHPELVVTEREFSGSLFHQINRADSSVNLLIGSRKFNEGWNSWRVSTMGLLNIGTTEGSQIIQLFGRGVRLKGYARSLKRSARLGVPAPARIHLLETLNVFGVRAAYMEQFREYLREERLPLNEAVTEGPAPVADLGELPLPKPVSPEPSDRQITAAPHRLRERPVVLNWYPRIETLSTLSADDGPTAAKLHRGCLGEAQMAFLDYDRLYFELQQFKHERGWYGLILTVEAIREILADPTWYTLYIPPAELVFDDWDKIALWQEIAEALLRQYCERGYHASSG